MLAKVHKLQIPTPFPVGPTNAWLIEGRPLTLVDTGPLLPESLAGMEAGLAAHGHRIEDLERLIISHGHIDHFGLSIRLKERSRAQLFLYTDERRMVETFHDTHRRIFARYEELSLRAGFPPDLLAQQRTYFDIFFRLAEDTKVDHVMADGDELDSGIGPLRVVHCPGHTPGSISLYHDGSRTLFSGDNLLRDITTNPFFGGNDQRKVGLVYYIPTLENLLAMDLARVLPGHGPEIHDPAALIRRIRRHHTLRGDLILEELRAGGAMTPYQVARALFPRLPATEVWLALADTMGHLEVLEKEGWVRTIARPEGDVVELTGRVPATSAIATPSRH